MSDSPTPATELHARRRPWTAAIRLDRCPVCPRCAAVLTPTAVHVVAHVAFCARCGPRDWWACLRDAQVMLTEHFNDHQCQRGGIRWYIPERDGPPSLLELASYIGVGHIYAHFPCTPDGYRLERPDNLDILTAQLDAEKARDTPYDHGNSPACNVVDSSEAVRRVITGN